MRSTTASAGDEPRTVLVCAGEAPDRRFTLCHPGAALRIIGNSSVGRSLAIARAEQSVHEYNVRIPLGDRGEDGAAVGRP